MGYITRSMTMYFHGVIFCRFCTLEKLSSSFFYVTVLITLAALCAAVATKDVQIFSYCRFFLFPMPVKSWALLIVVKQCSFLQHLEKGPVLKGGEPPCPPPHLFLLNLRVPPPYWGPPRANLSICVPVYSDFGFATKGYGKYSCTDRLWWRFVNSS